MALAHAAGVNSLILAILAAGKRVDKSFIIRREKPDVAAQPHNSLVADLSVPDRASGESCRQNQKP
jgi:hypothetical protein